MKSGLKIAAFLLISFCVNLTGQVPNSAFSYMANGLTVDFTDESTNGPFLSRLWDFGDGNTSTQVNPTHNFPGSGMFLVCLTVVNDIDVDSSCQTLNIVAPVPAFTKSFTPATVSQGSVSTLKLTIDNSAINSVTNNLDFTDNLPAGMRISGVQDITCVGGILTALPGTTSISYSGGSVPANGICEITVDVVTDAPGIYVNTTGDLTSSAGNSGPASATLQVTVPVPTMGQWGLIILSLMCCILGIVYVLPKYVKLSSHI